MLLMPVPLLPRAALLLSVLLLTACAARPPLSPPVPPPIIPPLPAAARQIDSLTWLDSVLADLQMWQQSLAEPSAAAEPARRHTTR